LVPVALSVLSHCTMVECCQRGSIRLPALFWFPHRALNLPHLILGVFPPFFGLFLAPCFPRSPSLVLGFLRAFLGNLESTSAERDPLPLAVHSFLRDVRGTKEAPSRPGEPRPPGHLYAPSHNLFPDRHFSFFSRASFPPSVLLRGTSIEQRPGFSLVFIT